MSRKDEWTENEVDLMLDDLQSERRPGRSVTAEATATTKAAGATGADAVAGEAGAAEKTDLMAVARLVKAAGRTTVPEPSPEFGERIVSIMGDARSAEAGLSKEAMPSSGAGESVGVAEAERSRETFVSRFRIGGSERSRNKRPIFAVWGIAAALVLFIGLSSVMGLWNRDVARAMARAVSKVTSYYGVLEKTYATLSGESQVVRRVEVWTSDGKYATKLQDGTLTVNDGQRKWQVRPDEQLVAILPLVPDPDRSGLDLKDQADRALQYPHRAVGEEIIAGRKAVCLEITPPGGLLYHLWVDSETQLPIQLRTAMQNGIQTTYTYVSLDIERGVDQGVFAYEVPEGYRVEEADPGQAVATPAEANGIAGFAPVLPAEAPQRIFAFVSGRVVLDYGSTTVTQAKAAGEFQPVTYGAIGTAAGGLLEIADGHLRWRQGDLEITVEGPDRLVLSKQIAADLTIPDSEDGTQSAPEVKVPVDIEVARNDQQQVDGGHSPWQLDPLQVSLTFVNLKVTPDGIVGEPRIGYGSFTLESSDGVRAIVKVSEGPVSRVYLERLVRQDDTGIWSVTGYDQR